MNKDKKHGQEVVDHPAHYQPRASIAKQQYIIDRINKRGHIEAIDIIDAWNLNFNLGSAIKYILRCGQKDDEITELEKTDWYVKDEIELRKAEREI